MSYSIQLVSTKTSPICSFSPPSLRCAIHTLHALCTATHARTNHKHRPSRRKAAKPPHGAPHSSSEPNSPSLDATGPATRERGMPRRHRERRGCAHQPQREMSMETERARARGTRSNRGGTHTCPIVTLPGAAVQGSEEESSVERPRAMLHSRVCKDPARPGRAS